MLSINLGWGLGVLIGVLVAAPGSGEAAHTPNMLCAIIEEGINQK